jgi:hypothetical protein
VFVKRDAFASRRTPLRARSLTMTSKPLILTATNLIKKRGLLLTPNRNSDEHCVNTEDWHHRRASTSEHMDVRVTVGPSPRIWLTDWLTNQPHRANSFLRRWQVLSYSRNSPHFMEPESSLSHSQQPANCPYPEPDRSNPCLPPPNHFSKILLILPPIYARVFQVI